MSKSINAPETPRSIRHQEILEIAAEQAELSMEEIAAEVPSATTDLVERVLDEYGDPATDAQGPTEAVTSEDMADEVPDCDVPNDGQNLTDAELEVLRAIHADPSASQRNLAESLDLSAATISKRATAIDGLDWENRESFVREFFEASPSLLEEDDSSEDRLSVMSHADFDRFCAKLDQLAEQIESIETDQDSSECFEDSELAHKVIHACMQSEEFSSDEEIEVIRSVTN